MDISNLFVLCLLRRWFRRMVYVVRVKIGLISHKIRRESGKMRTGVRVRVIGELVSSVIHICICSFFWNQKWKPSLKDVGPVSLESGLRSQFITR